MLHVYVHEITRRLEEERMRRDQVRFWWRYLKPDDEEPDSDGGAEVIRVGFGPVPEIEEELGA